MFVREKPHRLQHDLYVGERSVVFTLCLRGATPAFSHTPTVKIFQGALGDVMTQFSCLVPVYCFMPDHLHMIVTGRQRDSDTYAAVVRYKQKTGYWMAQNAKEARWQKDFYDHIIRVETQLRRHVRYILENPVRKGLVSTWQEYPFSGAIGCDLTDVLTAVNGQASIEGPAAG